MAVHDLELLQTYLNPSDVLNPCPRLISTVGDATGVKQRGLKSFHTGHVGEDRAGRIDARERAKARWRSYDELGNDDKRLFLDIACFFYGTMRSLLVKYMDSIHPDSYSRVDDLTNL
ncbi:hypothetical protein LINPERHAP1_LOCUS447 [Linum perenne]